MKRELGIGRCGLACCLCRENDHCFKCEIDCHQGLLSKIKPYTFTEFAKRYGEEELINCLEINAKNGVVYHKTGILGENDDFEDVEKLIMFIQSGKK